MPTGDMLAQMTTGKVHQAGIGGKGRTTGVHLRKDQGMASDNKHKTTTLQEWCIPERSTVLLGLGMLFRLPLTAFSAIKLGCSWQDHMRKASARIACSCRCGIYHEGSKLRASLLQLDGILNFAPALLGVEDHQRIKEVRDHHFCIRRQVVFCPCVP